jgi:hypothetical protein
LLKKSANIDQNTKNYFVDSAIVISNFLCYASLWGGVPSETRTIFPSLFGKLRALRENPDFMTTPSPSQIAKKTKFKLPTAYHQSLIFGDK